MANFYCCKMLCFTTRSISVAHILAWHIARCSGRIGEVVINDKFSKMNANKRPNFECM